MYLTSFDLDIHPAHSDHDHAGDCHHYYCNWNKDSASEDAGFDDQNE
jgi:hypothetical protein